MARWNVAMNTLQFEEALEAAANLIPAYTQCDFIDPRIDVSAQYALHQMLKGDLSSRKAAVGMFAAVKAGSLCGIYQQNQMVPALRARRMGLGWWQLIPHGQLAACVTGGVSEVPIIVFRPGLGSEGVRLGQALQIAWISCGLPDLPAPPPSGRPCPPRPPKPPVRVTDGPPFGPPPPPPPEPPPPEDPGAKWQIGQLANCLKRCGRANERCLSTVRFFGGNPNICHRNFETCQRLCRNARIGGKPLEEAELEQLLETAADAVEQSEFFSGMPINPEIAGVCTRATKAANNIRARLGRARARGRPQRELSEIRRQGSKWLSDTSNAFINRLDRFHPNDLDRLAGCLTRVEAVVGWAPINLQRLRAAVSSRLGMPAAE